jgi:hypothetical protein
MRTPVALIIFNRPDLTERVFAQIAKAKPAQLFIIADGPRPDRPGEAEKCQAARAVVDRIDWNCEVLKNYSDVNLGCGHRPASGISWVFEHVERAIILEDDVIPNLTFFRFSEELLERYQDDERVMQLCGHNYQLGQKHGPYSYYFSRRSICGGGWATWRRAWKHFDFQMKLWPTLRETSFLLDILEDKSLSDKWTKLFDTAYAGKPSSPAAHTADYWDYQWTFALWSQSGLSICPNTTLVTNVGYREDGTHTRSPNNLWANLPSGDMEFPLRHPPYIVRNREADHFFIALNKQQASSSPSVSARLRRKVAQALAGLGGKVSYSRSKPRVI